MACPVCLAVTYSGVSLSNGDVLHSACLQKLRDSIDATERTLSTGRAQVTSLNAQLARQDTFTGKVARFFGQGADPEDLRSRIATAEATLQEAERARARARARAARKVGQYAARKVDHPRAVHSTWFYLTTVSRFPSLRIFMTA